MTTTCNRCGWVSSRGWTLSGDPPPHLCMTPLETMVLGMGFPSLVLGGETTMMTCNRCQRTPVNKHHVCEDKLLTELSQLKDELRQTETVLSRVTRDRDQYREQLSIVQGRCTELLEQLRGRAEE